MINKLYSKLKQYIKENYKFLIILFIFTMLVSFPVPYYIHSTGGLINISDKVIVEDEYKSSGSFNLAYVTEMQGKVLTYLFSFVMKDWDLVKKEDVQLSNETKEELDYRNHMFLEEANQNALLVAYSSADKYVNITDSHSYVVYINEISNTDLKIKDEIISINDKEINVTKDYVDIVNNNNIGDKLDIKVKDEEGKIENKYIEVKEYENKKITGIYFITKYKYKAEPSIKFDFKPSESGPSGGFMMALAIYDKITKSDISRGRKIVGTGTIDEEGNVGEIGGVKYKLKSAVKEKADIFFVPTANYKEASKEQNENNYKINIIAISTFKDALNYLSELKERKI